MAAANLESNGVNENCFGQGRSDYASDPANRGTVGKFVSGHAPESGSARTSSLFTGILLTDEGGGVVSVKVRARDVVTIAYRQISNPSSGVI